MTSPTNPSAALAAKNTNPHGAVGDVVSVPWAPQPNTLTLHRRTQPGQPVPAPHTSVHVLVTAPSGVVVVNVRSRGWDLPGGHVEDGETVADAAIRELLEEAGLTVEVADFTVAGYAHLHVSGAKPDRYGYPYPDTYQPFLVIDLSEDPTNLVTQVPEEISEVAIVSRAELERRCAGRVWLPLATAVLAAVPDTGRSPNTGGVR